MKNCKNCIAKCTGVGTEGNAANCSYYKENREVDNEVERETCEVE